jgi:DNA-binding NtrC family response regulator
LRERREDILPLAAQFVANFTQGRAKVSSSLAGDLERYHWPGNVRELHNAMERASLLCRGDLVVPEHLPARIRSSTGAAPTILPPPEEPARLEEIEAQAVMQALGKNNFNRTATAKALGISRRALIYKLQRLREQGFPVDSP